MRYYTYILYSPSRYQYYIGQSHEKPEYVALQHNAGLRMSTRKGVPWQLVFAKQFNNSFESHLLMRKLQNMKSRKYIRYYINFMENMEVAAC